MEDFLQVGIITSTHGLKGEVKVFPTTDDIQRFGEYRNVYLDLGEKKLPMEIQGMRFFKNKAIVKFRGIDHINDVEQYKGRSLLITRDQAAPLKEGEYFISDLIGLTVKTDEGQELGTVKDVLQTGANDVYVVEAPGGKELLLPAIRECVLEIDPEQGLITVHLMEGLLD